MSETGSGRRRRLAEELEESGLAFDGSAQARELVIDEIDHALRPAVHERRVPSSGTLLEPLADESRWAKATGLIVTHKPIGDQPLELARRFTDGLSSWLIRRADGTNEWLVFDRPAGSERDLVVLADAFDATVVQRHPAGAVRVVGEFGVLRWDGFRWHREPPVRKWLAKLSQTATGVDVSVLGPMLEFAVHDLGGNGIGALLVQRPDDDPGPGVEALLPTPPALDIKRPTHLAPLRHALAQTDGAAVFDAGGVLRHLGVRLVPSNEAEETVDPFGGTRHTSARRYSRDDPNATVIAVSEDGPVSVLRDGNVIGTSRPRR